ncbi:MAG: PIG-L family deacetylase [Gammaproteobacteria bacterium]|nr:PIG-L family deacetylase [Gammaproteobacteria bacterium]
MYNRKQQLLKQHRRQKRISMLVIVALVLLLTLFVKWWLLPVGLLVAWLIHEAWFADHLFYAPSEDYRYRFPESAPSWQLELAHGWLKLPDNAEITPESTLILEIQLKTGILGRLLDPLVHVGDDQQVFERGAQGVRYLNLTGQAQELQEQGLHIKGEYCQLASSAKLVAFNVPNPAAQRLMILAPHADDAELAAFGLYSQASEVSIVTLTQGEIEAEHYQRLGISSEQAAQLKGRLRAWDSMAIPLWGGVTQSHCVQLGYYCLQLPEMAKQPKQSFASRESGETDIRTVRQHNPFKLPSDADGQSTWNNLVADLRACLEHYQPEIIVIPHPELDPHADHIATGQAFFQALEQSTHKPSGLLLYANHLHDNDRWPMGNANTGVALPPSMIELPADQLYCHVLNAQQQIDKAQALLMQHDLQTPLTLKRRLRRQIQRWLTGRQWPNSGENEFLRKAVRAHELFWYRKL